MLAVEGRDDGPAVQIMGKPRITDDAIQRRQQEEMLRLRLEGWDNRQIARYFHCTDRWVRDRLSVIPDHEKLRIAREFRYAAGKISVAG
jgi:hypothetical protein